MSERVLKHQKYRAVWNKIKDCDKAEITVQADLAPTIIQGIKRIKSEENAARPRIGKPSYPKLVITQELIDSKRGLLKISFSFLYSLKI